MNNQKFLMWIVIIIIFIIILLICRRKKQNTEQCNLNYLDLYKKSEKLSEFKGMKKELSDLINQSRDNLNSEKLVILNNLDSVFNEYVNFVMNSMKNTNKQIALLVALTPQKICKFYDIKCNIKNYSQISCNEFNTIMHKIAVRNNFNFFELPTYLQYQAISNKQILNDIPIDKNGNKNFEFNSLLKKKYHVLWKLNDITVILLFCLRVSSGIYLYLLSKDTYTYIILSRMIVFLASILPYINFPDVLNKFTEIILN